MRAVWHRFELWFWGKFFIFLIAVGAGSRGRRMSHNQGTGGRGKIRIVDNPAFPETEFFEAGREFPCRIRHGCVSFLDDTVNEVRGASLKFADSDWASPLDIQMNTGQHCFFWTARTFLEFAFWRHRKGTVQYVEYYSTYGWGRRSAASSFRRAPKSWTTMHYHSHTPFLWTAKDGKTRYVRFRLLPGDRAPDPDAPTLEYVDNCEKDPAQAPVLAQQKTLPADEAKSVNYLNHEWSERLKQGPIRYVLQIQLHEAKPDDPPEILNALLPWDEASHPYMDLATVEITQELTYAESQYVGFDITHHPKSIGILPAKSLDDFTSLNYMRKQSALAIKTRRLFQRLFGPPRANKDNGPHGLSPPGM
jgi:arachidonate 5-lipoxygenase